MFLHRLTYNNTMLTFYGAFDALSRATVQSHSQGCKQATVISARCKEAFMLLSKQDNRHAFGKLRAYPQVQIGL